MSDRTIVIILAGIAGIFGCLGLLVSFFCCWRQRSGVARVRLVTWRAVRIGIGLCVVAAIGAYIRWRVVSAGDYSVASAGDTIMLGRNASLGGRRLFPPDHPWNTRVDRAPVDSQSASYIEIIGAETRLHPDFGTGRLGYHLYGIPYVVVDGSKTPKYRLPFAYASESDDVNYPIPDNPPIEDGGDRHVLILDRENQRLYELFALERDQYGWTAGSGATWDLNSNVSRPDGWTSSDAAGLQILPGLARADEVYDRGRIDHALRFGLRKTAQAHRYPARHDASASHAADLPPMGLRLRLKATVRADTFPAGAAVIVRALQTYGMILADNAGPLFVGGTADRRWKRADMKALYGIRAGDFEVIQTLPPPPGDTVAWKEPRWKKPE